MPDLLLTHGYFLREDPKEQQIMKPYPTLGLLYLSAYLRRAGFGVEVFDTTFALRDELDARLRQGPGVLGVYTNLMTRGSVVRVLERARELDWTVVVGGPEAANYPERYLDHGAHVVVVGEGEQTMEELLPALVERGPHRLHGVRGTIFRDEQGALVENLPRLQIPDLDSLPWPDREQIDVDRYVGVWREHHGMGSVNLITARGCPYKCRWCSHAVYGYTHRRRSPKDCADELQWILERYQPDQVWYADDVFTIHHGWLFEYAEELERRGIKIPFETISRADRMRGSASRGRGEEEVIETLARMGCWRIWIGSESGSQRVLDAMERGVDVAEVQWATRTARRHGIQVGMFLMWGYEGETLDDIAATVEHVKASDPDTFLTTVAYPIKGTPYFREVEDRVEVGASWADSTDRDHQVLGRPPRVYYEHADRWLRSAVEAHRIRESDPARAAELEAVAQASRAAMEALVPPAIAGTGSGAMTASAVREEVMRSQGALDAAEIVLPSPFDSLAPDYDADFSAGVIGGLLRRAVWRRLDTAFQAGDHVLDLGCGTGEDALHLGARGVRVLALDASRAMAEVARAKVTAAGLTARVEVRRLAIERVAEVGGPSLELAGEAGGAAPFDGVVSNFGALNCVADLHATAAALGSLVRPGGRALLCLMGPLVPWEWGWHLLRLQPGKAFRRLRAGGVAWRELQVRYPSIGTTARAFSGSFRVREVVGLGVLLPPTYVEPWARRHPALMRALDRWERRLETTSPLPWLADHYLLDLERR